MAATARLEVRVRPEAKAKIALAADLVNLPVSDFVRSAAEDRAEEILREHESQTRVPGASSRLSPHARRRHKLTGVPLSGTQSRHSKARCPRLRRAEHGHVAVRTCVRGRGPPSRTNVRLDYRRSNGQRLLLAHRAPDRARRAAEVRRTRQPLGGTRRAAGPPCPG